MRRVHDIFTSKSGAKVAFIQYGTREEGWRYEVICPYCGKTVGYVDDPDDVWSTRQLFRALAEVMKRHIDKCQFNGAATLAVEKATSALNTEDSKPRIQ